MMPVTVTIAPSHRAQRHPSQISPPLLEIAHHMSELGDGMKITVLDHDGRQAAVIGGNADEDVELF